VSHEIKLLDVVALLEDVPAERLRRGQVGTIVDQWKDGVFEVEFSDNSGEAYAFAAVSAEKLLKLYFRKAESARDVGLTSWADGTEQIT
jgi:hypothetical protein